MRKIYKSKTNISINVVLPNKSNKHVAFMPMSDGSSVFTTDSEEVQRAIEGHYKYGKLFKLASVEDTATQAESATVASEAESERTAVAQVVKISDLASARDYLAERFGISRTIMRSEKAIKEQAVAHGIEFEGI